MIETSLSVINTDPSVNVNPVLTINYRRKYKTIFPLNFYPAPKHKYRALIYKTRYLIDSDF